MKWALRFRWVSGFCYGAATVQFVESAYSGHPPFGAFVLFLIGAFGMSESFKCERRAKADRILVS